MHVRWVEDALDALWEIERHVQEVAGDRVAKALVSRIFDRSEQIGTFPHSGRMVPERGLPELREVFEGPYRLIYRVKEDGVEVLMILHGARDFTE